MFNDLLIALDQKKEAVLVLLDMSAAFDTIDHSILLSRLSERFGISGTVLDWFTSYLHERTQTVVVADESSSPRQLLHGVPEGFVLGPVLFTLYVSPMEDIINAHELDSMFYADDTQIYIIFKRRDHLNAISKLENCIEDLKDWLSVNKLFLNDSKTEIVHVSSRFDKGSESLPDITIGNSEISTSEKARNLGVLVDSHLDLTSHVSKLCASASLGLRKVGQVRKFLSESQAEALTHAFISSRLDSCNALLYGLPDLQLRKVQRVQNAAARMVARVKKQEHITPVLHKLHWLPVKQRIKYKILLLTHKCIHGTESPTYLSELIQNNEQKRNLRSCNKALLAIPKSSTITHGDRAFSVAAPKLWNNIPFYIREIENINIFK